MELRHLRYLCAIADGMHVTRAAEQLHIAQPALTRQIRDLEAELGTPLLRRVGRRIELTEAGEVFYREAQVILDRVRKASLLAEEAARGSIGSISIGITESSVFSTGVTSVLRRFRSRWPAVEVSLVQKRTPELLLALHEHQIDAAFVRPPVEDTELEQIHFFSEPIIAAVHKSHHFSKKKSVSIGDLKNEPVILTSMSAGRNKLSDLEIDFTNICSHARFTPKIVQHTLAVSTAVNLVAAGFGVTLVPQCLKGMRADEVIYRPFTSTPRFLAKITLALRKSERSRTAENLRDEALYELARMTRPRKGHQ